MTTESLQIQDHLTARTYSTVLQHPAVEVEPVPNAAVCGSGGCRKTDYLVKVTIDGYGTFVGCPECAAGLLRREVEDV